jgi:hypothetical protein
LGRRDGIFLPTTPPNRSANAPSSFGLLHVRVPSHTEIWAAARGKLKITIQTEKPSNMKCIKTLVAALCVSVWLAIPTFAAEKTCCEKAKAEGKNCPHKCCVVAKKAGKICEKCNPKKKHDGTKAEGQNK